MYKETRLSILTDTDGNMASVEGILEICHGVLANHTSGVEALGP